jgi:molybdopterin-containing oxidoreductase family iron-sulfur binding subunit
MNMDEQTKQKPVEDVCPSKKGKLSLEDVQAKLEQTSGPQYWRSLEELAGAPEFHEMLHREFPKGASEWLDTVSRGVFYG